jgi:acyl-[acyl-carrier-protein] desaturase
VRPQPRVADLPARLEALADLESLVDGLVCAHESKRELWQPSELLAAGGPEAGAAAEPQAGTERARRLAERARGIPDACRVAIALNLVTEEGLPHFHRILAVHFGDDTFWRSWNNLWTAEENRHGAVLRDYCRDSDLLHTPALERMEFAYLKSGFQPRWEYDPYRVFVYTSLQEKATQVSHANTGKRCADYEPALAVILARVAAEEARHYTFYRQIFAAILERDPDRALESAAQVMPRLEMPGASMPYFEEIADVERRLGIYGPRDYLRIVEDQIRFWKIAALTGLGELGRRAQEKILAIPERLRRTAEIIERRSRSKTFSFELVGRREFTLE